MSDPILRLDSISKDFGEGPVLERFSLDVFPGEFLTLLGPSGCGKTTLLRIVAGLEQPTSGKVFLEGFDVTTLPPEKRNVNTVFQNYALFPHMNVFQNIAYGLKIQRISKKEQHERVMEALSLVRLSGYEKRMPSQLSGGQKQRVAIARAVVLHPKVLLLDEPLGALDLKLRQEMQNELKQLQQKLGITFIYITHDQEEALNMSSRIVIMRNGHIEQIGTPEDVYERPATLFAADFIGQSNLLHGVVKETDQKQMVLDVQGLEFPVKVAKGDGFSAGDRAVLCIRPQRVSYGADYSLSTPYKGILRCKEYVGGMQHTQISLTDTVALKAVSQSSELDNYPIGSEVYVGWSIEHTPVVKDINESEVL